MMEQDSAGATLSSASPPCFGIPSFTHKELTTTQSSYHVPDDENWHWAGASSLSSLEVVDLP